MTQASADRITLFVAALGLCTTLIAFFAFDGHTATSTGVGATLGFANLLALRTLVGRITNGQGAMPSFGGLMTDEEIAVLSDYIVAAKAP